MRCVECGRLKDAAERGWVIVLSPAGEPRTHYCCDCIASLVGPRSAADEVADCPDDG